MIPINTYTSPSLLAVTLQSIENDITTIANEIYRTMFEIACKMLSINVSTSTQFNLSSIWAKVESINNTVFLPVALNLVVIFFLIGFCATSVDAKQELRFELIFKLFFKLAITEALVYCSLDIAKNLLEFGTRFTTAIFNTNSVNTPMPYGLSTPIQRMSSTSRIFFVFITLIGLVVGAICGGILVTKAFLRLMKLVLIVPFGTLALSTVAGGGSQTLANVLPSFYKYFISTIMEAVSMAFGMYLCIQINSMITATNIDLFGLKNYATTLIMSGKYLCGATVLVTIFCIGCIFNVMIVLTAQNVASQSLGLK